jgi:hypothetical protein
MLGDLLRTEVGVEGIELEVDSESELREYGKSDGNVSVVKRAVVSGMGDAGTLDARLTRSRERSGEAGRRRRTCGRGNVCDEYGEGPLPRREKLKLWGFWRLRGVISSSASSEILLISGERVVPTAPEPKVYMSSAEK